MKKFLIIFFILITICILGYFYIIEKSIVIKIILLLFLITFNFIKRDIKNYSYLTTPPIENYYDINKVTLNHYAPYPEKFGIRETRLEYMHKCKYFIDGQNFNVYFWAIISSLYLHGILHKILIKYFYYINDTALITISYIIIFCISYRAIKNVYILILFNNFSSDEYIHYLLYLKALELYDNRIKLLKIEEERRIKQKKEYWQKHWANACKNGHKFEKEIGKLFRDLGYIVEVTKGSGDGGVDLILKKDEKIIIVQCKAHKHPVGPEPVRALWGVKDDFNANSAIFIASSGVTTGAQEFSQGKSLKILDIEDIIELSLQANNQKV